MIEDARLKFSADDWGLSPGINQAILELSQKQIIGTVSCMAGLPFVEQDLKALLATRAQFNIHFNLTYKNENNFASRHNISGIKSLIARLMAGNISSVEIHNEFVQQLEQLRRLGIPVTGLDGHHHVQLIPKVFHAIGKSLNTHGINHVRQMNDPGHLPSFLQSQFFSHFIESKFPEISFIKHGYLLSTDLENIASLKIKLKKYKKIITHPSAAADFFQYGINDSMEKSRLLEYKTLKVLANE